MYPEKYINNISKIVDRLEKEGINKEEILNDVNSNLSNLQDSISRNLRARIAHAINESSINLEEVSYFVEVNPVRVVNFVGNIQAFKKDCDKQVYEREMTKIDGEVEPLNTKELKKVCESLSIDPTTVHHGYFTYDLEDVIEDKNELQGFVDFMKSKGIDLEVISKAMEEYLNNQIIQLEKDYEQALFKNEFKQNTETKSIKEKINRYKDSLMQISRFKIERATNKYTA